MSRYCSDCDRDLPETAFARKTGKRLQSKCKECQRAYTKKWYQANKQRHIANVAANNRRQRIQMTRLVNAHLSTTPCMGCGQKFSAPAMLFDVDWEQSAKHLAYNAYSEDAVLAAIKDQKVVCSNCQRVRAERDGKRRKAAVRAVATAKRNKAGKLLSLD